MVAPIVKRFPKLRSPRQSLPVMSEVDQGRYPELAEDFAAVKQYLEPKFTELDLEALRGQNRYRRQAVIILLGAVILTALGGLQAVLPDQRWPTVALVVLGLALPAGAKKAGENQLLSDYLSARVKAERLRALYFVYLSRTGRYAGNGRQLALRQAVRAIDTGKEIE